MTGRADSNVKIAQNLDRHFALLRWAWQQQITPEDKLVLLALVTGGEVLPSPESLQQRTGIGAHAVITAIARLHERELIDVDLKPVGP